MKKLFVPFVLVMSLLLTSTSLPAQVVVNNSVIQQVANTFTLVFDALKNGDVRALKLLLPAEEYAQDKVLFEQNKGYPAFLRKFYQRAELRVGRVDSVLSAKDEVIAEFIIDLPSGESLTTRMRLKANGGGWRIRKILHSKRDQGESFGEDSR